MQVTTGTKATVLALPVNDPEAEFCWSSNQQTHSQAGAWVSNGGSGRSHPFRAKPYSLEVMLEGVAPVRGIVLVGAFALFADREFEGVGTLGASLSCELGREVVTRFELVNGRHYLDASDITAVSLNPGDGATLETVGQATIAGREARVDALRIEFLEPVTIDRIRFRDLGSPASFVLASLQLQIEQARGCPFHSSSGGIALSEIGSIVRMSDRGRMVQALEQLESSLVATEDLDEARGEALTFLAMVTAATLELGGTREMHRIQLESARHLDQLQANEDVAAYTVETIRSLVPFVHAEPQSPTERLVERALAFVERHFARHLTDTSVAHDLGLSTSHFRYLFRRATGQPFHRYLVNLRLEKARKLLLDESDLGIGDVAAAVGFRSLPHFSRAFTQRFSLNPTSLRDVRKEA
ncbi:MAG: helix-turn-helix domain-containing protein [Fimbriimonas sp.]